MAADGNMSHAFQASPVDRRWVCEVGEVEEVEE